MKTVIVGAGEVGYHIAKSLYKTHDVIIIDLDEDACERADELDVQVIHGNGANVSILSNILENVDLLVSVTGNDEVNIVVCMAAKLIVEDKKPIKTIARVTNPDYIDKPVAKRTQIGIDIMICPELALASEVADVLSIPSAIDSEIFADGKVEMMEFVVRPDNILVGKQMRDLQLSECCMVSALFRNAEVIIPHGSDTIEANDHMVVIGKNETMKDIRGIFGEITGKRTKTLIIGGGVVGFYLAKLINKNNMDLKIIDNDRERCECVADELPKVLVLHGDGTDVNLLKEEDVHEMDVVIAVTDSDEKNMLCALLSKQLGAKKVIARVDRSEYVPLFEMVGIDSAISPREATVNEVLKLTMGTGIEALTTIEGEKADIIEYTVLKESKIVGKPLNKIKFPIGALISMVVNKNKTIVPDGDYVIMEGDRVVVFSLPSAISDVERLFE
ncbi:MAG: Trk system potassium transporter TrkA [Methanosarcinaceae archaeon]